MRRVLDAAEAGIRTRGRALERKVLQAASMGYSKGVAAGKASDAAARDAAARELETLRRELEDARSALGDGSVAGGSVYDDAASTPDDASALGGKSGVRSAAGAAGARKEKRFPGIPEGTDSAKEGPPSTSGAPSTPDASVAGAAPPRSTALMMPRDAGAMPAEVSLRSSVGGSGASRGEGGGAPTAALWALSVSARDGLLPSAAARDALDLISSRCQLFFAHDKLARASAGLALAKWRLACEGPRRRRSSAEEAARRRSRRVLARCFDAWRRPEEDAAAGTSGAEALAERTKNASKPPPPLDRKHAAGLVVELRAAKLEASRLAGELAALKAERESAGPTPREAAQSEKFRAHLQRVQRELEAARQERDAVKNLAGRASREEERVAGERRQRLRSQATQVGGSGALAVAAEDTAGTLEVELQAQAARFHAQFEKQASIADEAERRLREEASARARTEDQHRRELARLREEHAAEMAAVQSEFARSREEASRRGGGGGASSRGGDDARPPPRAPRGAPARLTAEALDALDAEAGRMRHSEKVEEKVNGWEVTAAIAEAGASVGSPGASPNDAGAARAPARIDDRDAADGWGDRAQYSRRPGAPRAPLSATGSERSARSRPGVGAAVVTAMRAGGKDAVEALLADRQFAAAPERVAPEPGPRHAAHPGAETARPAPASATLATARLVMLGHGKAEAAEALAAVGNNDVDAAHEWILDERARAQNAFFA